jgi:hypothetical protein
MGEGIAAIAASFGLLSLVVNCNPPVAMGNQEAASLTPFV